MQAAADAGQLELRLLKFLLFMIIRLVAHGDLFLSDLTLELAVHRRPYTGHRLGALFLEDAAHVIEE